MVERFAVAVFFDDFDGRGLDAFVGRITSLAADAFAAAADGKPVLACPRIEHPIVILEAIGAFHGRLGSPGRPLILYNEKGEEQKGGE